MISSLNNTAVTGTGIGLSKLSSMGKVTQCRNKNELIAYYLKNAPKLFVDNKKRVNKMLLMRGKSVLNMRRAVSQMSEVNFNKS